MIATHIHLALAQIRELKVQVLSAQHFTGYSGQCRAAGGTAALAAPLVMSANGYPQTEIAHLIGWGIVLAFALFANDAALVESDYLSVRRRPWSCTFEAYLRPIPTACRR